MAMAINSTARATENMEYVRSLLKQRQPEFAAALERAAMLAEKTPQSQRRRLISHPTAGIFARGVPGNVCPVQDLAHGPRPS
jgi:hypothetical protein